MIAWWAWWAPFSTTDYSRKQERRETRMRIGAYALWHLLLLATNSTSQSTIPFSTPGMTATYSTFPISERRRKFTECSLESISSQTMQRSPVTLTKSFGDLFPALRTHSQCSTHHQPEDNQHHGPRCQYHTYNYHQRSHFGSGRQAHLTRLYNL